MVLAFETRVHLTLAEDAWNAGLPVVPCAVMHTERTLPPGVIGAYPLEPCRLHIGTPIRPEGYADDAAFAEACWGEVAARVAALEAEDAAVAPSLAPQADVANSR